MAKSPPSSWIFVAKHAFFYQQQKTAQTLRITLVAKISMQTLSDTTATPHSPNRNNNSRWSAKEISHSAKFVCRLEVPHLCAGLNEGFSSILNVGTNRPVSPRKRLPSSKNSGIQTSSSSVMCNIAYFAYSEKNRIRVSPWDALFTRVSCCTSTYFLPPTCQW